MMQMGKVAKTLYVGFHTAKRMQPRQIIGIGSRKSRELLLSRLPVDFDRRYERRVPTDPEVDSDPIAENTTILRDCLDEKTREQYRDRARGAADGSPTFMNRTRRVNVGSNVNWYDDRFDDLPLLWPLKLYAFQPLDWAYLGFDPGDGDSPTLQSSFDSWIEDWNESVEIGRSKYLRRAWTPWAVSLRILHWSRYLSWRDTETTTISGLERAFKRELYKNTLFMENHVERDVGGNHLIENGIALLTAGVLFDDPSWVSTGRSILEDATDQFLDDGFHFERSPMYHVLTLTRYLTACDLLQRSGRNVPAKLRRTASRATAFLRFLRPPDGRLPLLNDSVYGQGLPLNVCLEYAEALGFGEDHSNDHWSLPFVPEHSDHVSGYRWLRTDAGAMLVDGGPVGPPHLPGHSHNDTLSYLLWLGNQPVVTDTGTFEYVSGPRREYARGVRGHNTVQVGSTEPIELGGKYLMGRRSDPTTRVQDGPVTLFEGVYDGLPFGGPQYTHHRSIFAGDSWWCVWDTVREKGEHPVRSRLHLHPDIEVSRRSNEAVRIRLADRSEAFVHPLGRTQSSTDTSEYYPRFGVASDRQTIEMSPKKTFDEFAAMGYLLTPQDVSQDTVEIHTDGIVPTELELGADRYALPSAELLSE